MINVSRENVMKYLLSISNAADVRAIATHDLQELGISFDSKYYHEEATNFKKSRSRENSLVSTCTLNFSSV